ncbi:MAG: Histidine biosynthesis bifunctional protein HisIE : Phosphoribosyl-AMP cyclohydrolase [Bacteroidota bacterium]|jgi:phosphoribosyl-ATP pyrophosphohydrolase/phosphoribosyl-AMP cyclohydrolase
MEIDFSKVNGLVPAIIQDAQTMQVLMLGYMNEDAFKMTQAQGKVTFYSRSKQRLWTKGEESGNFLNVKSIKLDCDGDALLIQVDPVGPTCHTGTKTCWQEEASTSFGILSSLEETIRHRWESTDAQSYVASLKSKGTHKIAQKVGEEAVETVIEALRDDDELFLAESADLLFHYLVLLKAKGFQLEDVLSILRSRMR